MKISKSIAAVLAVGAFAGLAQADFAVGNMFGVSVTALGDDGAPVDLGHGTGALGTDWTFWDPCCGDVYPVYVGSSVIAPWSAVFYIDFIAYNPAAYGGAILTVTISGLKDDNTIVGVQGNANFSTDGNSVWWTGTGIELGSLGALSFKAYQPAPGALALLGMVGLAGSRRRRA